MGEAALFDLTEHRGIAQLRHDLCSTHVCISSSSKEQPMPHTGTILLVILILLLGVVPLWPHSRGWGYGPSGGPGLILVIVVD